MMILNWKLHLKFLIMIVNQVFLVLIIPQKYVSIIKCDIGELNQNIFKYCNLM